MAKQGLRCQNLLKAIKKTGSCEGHDDQRPEMTQNTEKVENRSRAIKKEFSTNRFWFE